MHLTKKTLTLQFALRIGISIVLALLLAVVPFLSCAGTCGAFAFAEENQPSQSENSANSWRYSDGVPISSEGIAWDEEEEESDEAGSAGLLSWTYHPDYDFYIADNFEQFTGGYYTGTTAARGVDVSQWQGSIDWSTASNYIDYAIVRCGYGSDYYDQDDTKWTENVSGCKSNSIPFGVYLYSYATNTSMAYSEAQHVLRCLSAAGVSAADLDYPIYLDLEDNSTVGSDFAAIAQAFCGTLEAAGYEAGVYASTSWWENYLTSSTFNQWSKWAAQWSSQGYGLQYGGLSDFENSQGMWQFSDYGSLPGIDGRVDLDYSFYEKPDTNVPTTESFSISGLSVQSGIAYIDGSPVSTSVSGNTVSLQVPAGKHTIVMYAYNSTSGDVHAQYPTHMYVWIAKKGTAGNRVSRCSSLDDVLTYAGSSIRITGTKGIRMITSIPTSVRTGLINGSINGYTLQEYGTVVAWDSDLNNGTLTLNSNNAKSNYAYKRNVSDAIYSQNSSTVQYTNVLVGFSLEKCIPDLSMRSYLKFTDPSGTEFVLYGGVVHRSIGYIAKQNENAFSQGTDAYNYIHEIIDYVY